MMSQVSTERGKLRNKPATLKAGFTLIEMMIVVAIIGILAAIAYPSYQNYILSGHRVEARNQLQAIAQRLEQNFTANRSYACSARESTCSAGNTINTAWLVNQGYATVPVGSSGQNVRYNISFSGDPTATTYTLQAVPANAQAADTECGTFTLNQSNVKTAGGAGSRDTKSRSCWGS